MLRECTTRGRYALGITAVPESSRTQSDGGRWTEVAYTGKSTTMSDFPTLSKVPSKVVSAFLKNLEHITAVHMENRVRVWSPI